MFFALMSISPPDSTFAPWNVAVPSVLIFILPPDLILEAVCVNTSRLLSLVSVRTPMVVVLLRLADASPEALPLPPKPSTAP